MAMHPTVVSLVHLAALLLLFSGLQHLLIPACHAATEYGTLLPTQGLTGGDTLLSSNGRFALGFFQQTGNSSSSSSSDDGNNSSNTATPKWYLGIWFHTVPKLTPVWVANPDNPIVVSNLSSCKLVLSTDGNLLLVVEKPATGSSSSSSSTVWSSKTNATTTNGTTTAMAAASLLDSGNLVVHNASNASTIFWQSFDHPTDTFLQGGKIGWSNTTTTGGGVIVRRLVSQKNSVSQSPGLYSFELSPSPSPSNISGGQFSGDTTIVSMYNSSKQYWSSGTWGGRYFSNIPETAGQTWLSLSFTTNDHETYIQYAIADPTVLSRGVMEVSGQMKVLLWFEGSSTDWQAVYTAPKSQCDAYAACGPFTVCNDDASSSPSCVCMKGYSVRSPEDWDLGDRTGGCERNTPLHCNSNITGDGDDKFYAMAAVQLPSDAQSVGRTRASNEDECAVACLGMCSCTAYSYDDDGHGGGGCSIWHGDLINVRQQQQAGNSVLHLRLAANEMETTSSNSSSSSSGRGVIIGAITATLGLTFLLTIWVMMRRKKKKRYGGSDNVLGIIAFRYADLQCATRNFSQKLGAGSFGSVFKGSLISGGSTSTTVAVKRLDGVRQGEKQFRAEVSSIGVVQHVNLVKLIGFCCEGDRRLLVYEHMPNGSLDSHLFLQSGNKVVLDWAVRYQIALGVARGLAYLHASCRDRIIHCDIKPENILLDGSFTPKVADFGMATISGRDFSHVLTTMRGTIGYLAPEWISGTPITSKVDAYSYGMVLLEIVSGSRNVTSKQLSSSRSQDDDGVLHEAYFPVRVARALVDGDVASLVDANLLGDANMEEVERVCKVACWCIQDVEFDRPTMGEVVRYLECLSEVGTPPVPRFLQSIAGQPNSKIM